MIYDYLIQNHISVDCARIASSHRPVIHLRVTHATMPSPSKRKLKRTLNQFDKASHSGDSKTHFLAVFPGDRGPSGRIRHRFRKLNDTTRNKLFTSLELAVEDRQQQRRSEFGVTFDGRGGNVRGSIDDDNPFLGFPNDISYDADSELPPPHPITTGRQLLRLNREKKNSAENRKRLQQSWEEIYPWLQDALLGLTLDNCQCPVLAASEVRIIGLDGIRTISHEFCHCGKRCAKLLEQGLFPASPKRPQIVFQTTFLTIFYGLSMRGACSGQAFAETWRDFWEQEYSKRFTRFDREVCRLVSVCGVSYEAADRY